MTTRQYYLATDHDLVGIFRQRQSLTVASPSQGPATGGMKSKNSREAVATQTLLSQSRQIELGQAHGLIKFQPPRSARQGISLRIT